MLIVLVVVPVIVIGSVQGADLPVYDTATSVTAPSLIVPLTVRLPLTSKLPPI